MPGQPRRLLTILSSLLIILVSIPLQADNHLAARPSIIDIWPLPGVELAPTDMVTISFNQPMQQTSLDAALSIQPRIDLSLTWSDDRTLIIGAVEGWSQDTVYQLTISTTAQAQNGLKLPEPYRVDLHAARSLQVASISPEDGTEGIAADQAQIVVTFDRPVVALTSISDQANQPKPVQFIPAISGLGQWATTSIYVFNPTIALQGDTRYIITVPAGLTAVDGSRLMTSTTSTFRTLPPQTYSVEATRTWTLDGQSWPASYILLDSHFEVTFSQPMDPASTEGAFHLEAIENPQGYGYDYLDARNVQGALVPGTFAWNYAGTKLTFIPSDRLLPDHDYFVIVETSAQSRSGGAALLRPVLHSFQSVRRPAVLSTVPANGENIQPGLRRIRITFNTLMNTDSFEGRYRITPEPEGEVTPYVNARDELILEFRQTLGTTYTITLLPGIEDGYDNVTTTPFEFSYFVRVDDLRTNVQFTNLRGDYTVLGTYQEEAFLSATITGSPTITQDIYRLDLDTLTEAYAVIQDNFYYPSYWGLTTSLYAAIRRGELERVPWATPDRLISTWSESYDVTAAGREGESIQIPLQGADGQSLPAGLYGVEMTAPGVLGWDRFNKMGFILAVSDYAITIKSSPGEMLAWVTDFVTSEPISQATVTAWQGGEVIASGQTDAQGFFRLTNPPDAVAGKFFITVETDDGYAFWQAGISSESTETNTYLYTDRPIYRPGETIYYRGVVRDQDDMIYSLPNIEQARVKVGLPNYYYDPYTSPTTSESFYDERVDVTDFGTFSGQITLPADLSPGSYQIEANDCLGDYDAEGNFCRLTWRANIYFTVAEFRVPEYEVEVTLQQDEIISGDPINALVSADYYSGGALPNGRLTWNLWENYYYGGFFSAYQSFAASGARGYTFRDENWGYFNSQGSPSPVRMDAQGQYLIDAPLTIQTTYPVRIAVEATVQDASGQTISARGNVLVHPANVYVGIRSSVTFAPFGSDFDIDLLTLFPDQQIRPEQVVDIEVIEFRWVRDTVAFGQYQWREEQIPVTTTQVTTGADAKAAYVFTPPNVGIFRIRATTTDEKGRLAASSIRVYARAAEGASSGVWWDPYTYEGGPCGNSAEYRVLRMIPNASSYRPGDTAEVFIPNPWDSPATALITVERAGILQYETVTIRGDGLTWSLPIVEGHAPNIFIGAVLMKGIGADNPDPLYIRGSVQLMVEPTSRRLNVALSASENTAKPGDSVTFDVQVTDWQGNPVQAEVGLALTDEAVLALSPPNSGTLEQTFYRQRPLSVTTSASIRSLLNSPDNTSSGGCGGGGGGGDLPPDIREEFIYTPLWSPHTVTDTDGRATVSVTMPDNLTRWRLDARAITLDTQVGQAAINMTSTLPLIVRPSAPRFFVVGDMLPLVAVVNNFSDSEQAVDVTLQSTGLQVNTPLTQTVTLPPGASARLEWAVVVEDVRGVDLTVSAVSQDYQDAAKPALRTGPNDTIPVYRYTATETVSTSGILTEAGSVTEAISLPTRLSRVDGELILNLDPSLASAAVDGLDYLENFPHQCIEQTVSRFLPNVITYRALRELNLADAELRAGLDEALAIGLDQLTTSQNPDGGWGWFSDMESNPYVTAYALLGLAEARDTGYAISAAMLEQAANYLSGQFITLQLNTPTWQLDRQAFLIYVLARAGVSEAGTLLDRAMPLHVDRLELSHAGRATLLMAFIELDPVSNAAGALASDLTSAAILSASGAHWEEAETDWWNWGSDTRSTALALAALVRHDSKNALLPNVVRWLMIARRGTHWPTTQETAWSVIALTDWMVATGELQGSYRYSATLNDTPLGAGQVTPATVQQGQMLSQDINSLLRQDLNALTIERGAGEGALYYTASLDLQLPADEVEAVSRGIMVSREFLTDEEIPRRISQAQIGDIVRIRLSMIVSQDVHYFVLQDTLPAGLEIIDRNLLTATQTVDGPGFERQSPRWGWGYWYFSDIDLRDKGANLYAQFLPRGSYTFTYQARVTAAGQFQVIPAQAYAFYQPEVFGRSDGGLFTVIAR
jgi:alpha-2-macroglobulin